MTAVDQAVRAEAERRADVREAIARDAVVRSLRPRLRWAVCSPALLRVLKRTPLWNPPTIGFDLAGQVVSVRTRGQKSGPTTHEEGR
jgi:hypothetical protein